MLMGIVKGDNPLTVARNMRDVGNVPLTRAMRIARTEQLNIFRKTSLESMKKSGVVSAWQWYAVSTDACSYCLEHHGKNTI
jgi:SPP1 gp7 family putative phage head morphogenesis protein